MSSSSAAISNVESSISQFCAIFPDVTPTRAREILIACTGRVDAAIEYQLTNGSATNAGNNKMNQSTIKPTRVIESIDEDDEDEVGTRKEEDVEMKDSSASSTTAAASLSKKRKDIASAPSPAKHTSSTTPTPSPSKKRKTNGGSGSGGNHAKDEKQHSLTSFFNRGGDSSASASAPAPPMMRKPSANSRKLAAMQPSSTVSTSSAVASSPSSFFASFTTSSPPPVAASSAATAASFSPSTTAPAVSATMLSLSSNNAASSSAASSSLDSTDPLQPCWKPREPVPFVFLSRIYSLIEVENGRIKIINYLTYLFWQILAYTPGDLAATLFLSSDQLAPSYENHQLGIGGHMLAALVREMTGMSRQRMQADHATYGDLGIIAQQYRLTQSQLFRPPPLLVSKVFAAFHSLSTISKRDAKVAVLKKMFAAAKESELTYLIRIAEGGLRIGSVVTTVLTALAKAFTLHHLYCEDVPEDQRHTVCTFERIVKATEAVKGIKVNTADFVVQPCKSVSEIKIMPAAAILSATVHRRLPLHLALATARMRRAYAELPSFHAIMRVLMTSPIAIYELHKHIQLTAGVPIKPQLGRPMTSILSVLKLFRGKPFTVEVKYDGLRAQIHRLRNGTYKIFSRHLMDQGDRWSDLVPMIEAAIKMKGEVKEFILDAEIVAVEHLPPVAASANNVDSSAAAASSSSSSTITPPSFRILPFQQLSTRKRGSQNNANGGAAVAASSSTSSAAAAASSSSSRTEVSCMVYVFDFLSLNSSSLLLRSLPERRALMSSTFNEIAGQFQFVEHVDITKESTEGMELEDLEEDESETKGKGKKGGAASSKKASAASKKEIEEIDASSDEEKEEKDEVQHDDEENELKGTKKVKKLIDDEEEEINDVIELDADEAIGMKQVDAAPSSAAAVAAASSSSSPSLISTVAPPSASDLITTFLNNIAITRGEGIMAKSLSSNSTYEPDVRTDEWCKLKKDYIEGFGIADSIDVVIIGGWWGNGRKAGWISPFLAAVYNPETEEYESFAKIMSGFSDVVYKQFTAECMDLVIDQPKKYYRVSPELTPTMWFEPVKIWEIRGADLTISPSHSAAVGLVHPDRGISLRFPRFIRVRDDKSIEQATTSEQIAALYRGQHGVHPQQQRRFPK